MQKINFKLSRVKLADLKTAVAYQRAMKKAHVKRIIATFDPDSVQAINVGKRSNGSMYIVDGQHLCAALMEMGYTHWPCQVFPSTGRAHEAQVFRICNSSQTRKAVNKIELWRALLVEGDPNARAINKMVKEFGYTIDNSPQWPNIKAVGIVQKLYEEDALEDVLWLLHDAWGEYEDADMLSAYIIAGLGGYVISAKQKGAWDNKLRNRLLAKMKRSSPKRMRVAIADRCQGSGYNRARAGVTEFGLLLRKGGRAKSA